MVSPKRASPKRRRASPKRSPKKAHKSARSVHAAYRKLAKHGEHAGTSLVRKDVVRNPKTGVYVSAKKAKSARANPVLMAWAKAAKEATKQHGKFDPKSPKFKALQRKLAESYLGKRHSPKKHSPKRKSPKKHSPKRKSPKKHSPKRKSPKKHSPKRKSPKKHSPKRKSPKRK